jgi:hypothetical protein
MEENPNQEGPLIHAVIFQGRVFIEPIVRFHNSTFKLTFEQVRAFLSMDNVQNMQLEGPDVLKITLRFSIPVSTCTTEVLYLRAL